MSASATLQPDPSAIGGVPKTPFVLLPDPLRLFGQRAERFAGLQPGSALAPYLGLLAGLCRVQAAVARDLPPLTPLDPALAARASDGGMPPIDRHGLMGMGALDETLDRFFAAAEPLDKPAPAAAALEALRHGDPAARAAAVTAVLTESPGEIDLATHLFAAAATQIHVTRMAAGLEAAALKPVAVGVCPACGGRPVASMVIGLHGAEGTRFAACSLCNTLWNEVRIKCLACGSTKGIGYRAVEADAGEATVKAEVCDECRSWVKILYQNKNPSLEVVADDVASLGLDLLMRETDYRRAGYDPLVIGY